jgi:hypothetical protein
MYNRAFLVAALITACTLFAPAVAAETDPETCNDYNIRSEVRIAACTRIISAGETTGKDLASAYYNRGMAHADCERVCGPCQGPYRGRRYRPCNRGY